MSSRYDPQSVRVSLVVGLALLRATPTRMALEPPLRWSRRCGHRDQADQFVGEGFCCKKVILLIMGYLPFRNLIKFSQVHNKIVIFEDSHVNLSGDEGIFANRICFSQFQNLIKLNRG